MKNILGIVLSYVYIFAVIFSAKLVEKRGTEASRKYIHIMLANWWFIAMFFFDNVFFASFGPASFVIINYISYQKNLIAVMERNGKQDGLGTVYYAISLLVLSLILWGFNLPPVIGLAGVLVMGYGDGFAAVIGKSVKSYAYKIGNSTKTLAGSLTMFILSFAIIATIFFIMQIPLWHVKGLGIALIATLLEAVSIKGTDNITVPLITSLLFGLMI